MPFKSEKQRKYLWANEPKIAKEWTQRYGSRTKYEKGGCVTIMIATPMKKHKIKKKTQLTVLLEVITIKAEKIAKIEKKQKKIA